MTALNIFSLIALSFATWWECTRKPVTPTTWDKVIEAHLEIASRHCRQD